MYVAHWNIFMVNKRDLQKNENNSGREECITPGREECMQGLLPTLPLGELSLANKQKHLL